MLLAVAAVPGPASGQDAVSLSSQDEPVRIAVSGTAERAETDSQRVTQRSVRLAATVPITDRLVARLVGQAASATAPRRPRLRGLDDARASLTYTQPLPAEASLVASARANLPVGRTELSLDGLRTAGLLQRDYLDTRVAGLGRGLGLSPSLALALPLGDRVTVGATGSFRYLGGYRPVAAMSARYVPGNTWRLGAGLDWKPGPTSALSADVAYVTHGTDTVGGAPRFALGDALAVTARYLHRFSFNVVRLSARYRDRRRSTVYGGPESEAARASRALRVVPSTARARAELGMRLADGVRLRVRTEGALYRQTARYGRARVGRAALRPRVQLTDALALALRAEATLGDVRGWEGGARLEVAL
jgi:hypothetical protein